MKVDLQLALDYAIRDAEIEKSKANDENPPLTYGYKIDGKKDPYDNYMSNKSFEKFKSEMNPDAFKQYGKGGGSELKERKNKAKVVVAPPKMASFGSSSRMMYNTAKNIKNFSYEEKLHTTVGGTANLDGYVETDEYYVFVEAKCREPYGTKNDKIKISYKKLYEDINNANKQGETYLYCDIKPEKSIQTEIDDSDEYMRVDFYFNNGIDKVKIQHFDVKQMICHLLGIGTAMVKGGKYLNKPTKFIYLIYNPENLKFESEDAKNDIMAILKHTFCEGESVITEGLFKVILEFLKEKIKTSKAINVDQIAENFRFVLSDQIRFEEKLYRKEM